MKNTTWEERYVAGYLEEFFGGGFVNEYYLAAARGVLVNARLGRQYDEREAKRTENEGPCDADVSVNHTESYGKWLHRTSCD